MKAMKEKKHVTESMEEKFKQRYDKKEVVKAAKHMRKYSS